MRDSGFAVHMHVGGGSFKAQMRRADSSMAPVALIIGDNEVSAELVTVKPLRAKVDGETSPQQFQVALPKLADALGDFLFSE